MKKKTVALLLALVLVFGIVAGGTFAWLTANTGKVTNTFTYGDINIKLWEHAYDAKTNTISTGNTDADKVQAVTDYKIIPGVNLPKDPTVEVVAGSEECWLFVKVTEEGTFVANKVTYSIDSANWSQLETADGTKIANVYYKKVTAQDASKGVTYTVLEGDKVTVSDKLTKDELEDVTTSVKLSFQAAAVQAVGFDEAFDAFKEVASSLGVTLP